jgi:RND family efflux transporter MFP subunit
MEKINQKNRKATKTILQILLLIAFLGCAAALASYYMKTSPKAEPRKRPPSISLVRVEPVQFKSEIYIVNSLGTVVGAKDVLLAPKVSGEVIEISQEMEPGGFFRQGSQMVTIDPSEYELNVLQLQSEVDKAKSNLELEMGNQRIAKKEFEILGEDASDAEKNLMLRYPQLGIAKSNLKSAEAKLAQARLDLSRTQVKAPFSCTVLSKNVDVGSRVGPTTTLAEITGTDTFWVKLALPVKQLRWLHIPSSTTDKGSKVQIFLNQNKESAMYRTGKIIRLAADLEEQGRMAVVYVAVDDPLCLKNENQTKPKLLLGSFVRAEISGRKFSEMAVIKRDHLRENDQVWILRNDNTLEIRDVSVAARTHDKILIKSGLQEGEKLIISNLATPVEGITLKNSSQQAKLDKTNRQAGKQDVSGKKIKPNNDEAGK